MFGVSRLSVLPAHFCYKPKIALKIKSIKKNVMCGVLYRLDKWTDIFCLCVFCFSSRSEH